MNRVSESNVVLRSFKQGFLPRVTQPDLLPTFILKAGMDGRQKSSRSRACVSNSCLSNSFLLHRMSADSSTGEANTLNLQSTSALMSKGTDNANPQPQPNLIPTFTSPSTSPYPRLQFNLNPNSFLHLSRLPSSPPRVWPRVLRFPERRFTQSRCDEKFEHETPGCN